MCQGGNCWFKGLQASLDHQGLTLCTDCAEPSLQGIFVDIWACAFGPDEFSLSGEVVLAVPNDASRALLNPVAGAIVIAERGRVPFATKAKMIQEAGALAAIIADDGSCGDTFQCGGPLGSRDTMSQARFAARDDPGAWAGVRIPVVMISNGSYSRIRRLMATQQFTLDGHGVQHYCP